MPQAPDYMRLRWLGPSDRYATGYLEGRGYLLDEDYCWTHPEPGWEPTNRDFDAMDFMALEWDYGGWAGQTPEGMIARNRPDTWSTGGDEQ